MNRAEGRAALERLLEAHRARLFVGRVSEIEVFEAMLRGESPLRVLYLEGPGGIGKTQLLRALSRVAEGAGAQVAWIDGRSVSPTASALEGALTRAGAGADAGSARRLIVLDGFEHLRGLESWWREEFLPQLGDETLIVFAGRARLDEAWRADAGWRSLLRVVPLGSLSREESAEYLARRGVDESRFGAMFEQTLGHPLALALLSEVALQAPGRPVELREHADILQRLVEQFVRDVPSELHARALRASAVALHTTEPLLRRMLGVDSAHQIFDWLAGRTFMLVVPAGIMPHDGVRQIILESLRWQSPGFHRELVAAAMAYYEARIRAGEFSPDRELGAGQFLFAQGHGNLELSTYLGERALRPVRDDDWPAIEEMTARHEGPGSVELLRFWRDRPGEWTAISEPNAPCLGFVHMIPLEQLPLEHIARDPAATCALRHVHDVGVPLDQGRVWLIRWWMAAEEYQSVSATQTWIFHHFLERLLATPRLLYLVQCTRDTEAWKVWDTPSTPYAAPGYTYHVDGQQFGLVVRHFDHQTPLDWYRSHFVDWLHMAGYAPASGAREPRADAPLTGDRDAFAAAVRRALRAVDRPDRLGESPLVDLPVVAARCPDGSRIERARALADLLHEHAQAFQRSPRDEILYQVLERARFRPALKHTAAAAELGISYSTFRRHLTAATRRLTELLWEAAANHQAP